MRNGSSGLGVQHFSCKFPHKMALVTAPSAFRLRSPMCSHMCALICVHSYVCSQMCGLLCVLSSVLVSCVLLLCSPMWTLICHTCTLICVLAYVCFHMCAPIYVCSDMSLPPLVSYQFAPPRTVWGLLPGFFSRTCIGNASFFANLVCRMASKSPSDMIWRPCPRSTPLSRSSCRMGLTSLLSALRWWVLL